MSAVAVVPVALCWHSHCTSCCECVPEEEQTEKVISLAHDGRVDDGDHIQQLIRNALYMNPI